jgi:hypothetical protein
VISYAIKQLAKQEKKHTHIPCGYGSQDFGQRTLQHTPQGQTFHSV